MAKKAKTDEVVTDEVKTDEVVTDEVKTDEVVTEKVETKKSSKTEKVLKFSKKQFVNSKRFAKRTDILNALLDDDKMYSIEQVEKIINDFLYGKKK